MTVDPRLRARTITLVGLMGAGKSGNSKRENSPGASGMAKIIECSFHCSLHAAGRVGGAVSCRRRAEVRGADAASQS